MPASIKHKNVRSLIFIIFVLMVFTLPYCVVHKKKNNMDKYDIPANYPPEMVDNLVSDMEKGESLFKTYCADCHGIFSNGRDSIPDFTDTQLHKYTARYMMGDPTNHAAAFKMNPDQLNQIVVFLTYRRVKHKHTDSLDRR